MLESVTLTTFEPDVVENTGAVLVMLVCGVMLTRLLPVKTLRDDSAPIPRWLMALRSAQPLSARIAEPIAEL